MYYSQQFTCQKITHEGEDINGFCLNLDCKASAFQFCFKCYRDPVIHQNCKKDLHQYDSITNIVNYFNRALAKLLTQLNKSFEFFQIKYQELKIQLQNIKNKFNSKFDLVAQQDYKEIKNSISYIKEAYDYLNNQEDLTKQNQIKSELQSFILHLIVINDAKNSLRLKNRQNFIIQQLKSTKISNKIKINQKKIRSLIKI